MGYGKNDVILISALELNMRNLKHGDDPNPIEDIKGYS